MTTSRHRTYRTVRRAACQWISALALPLVLGACGDRPDAVEHTPAADDSVAGPAAKATEYVFDPAAVRTLQGTVLALEPFQRMQGTRYGVRVRLDVEGERAYVYLAPQGFLADEGLLLAPGDRIEVTGSVLGEEGQRVVIATEVVEGSQRYALRDAEGRPLWRGGRRE